MSRGEEAASRAQHQQQLTWLSLLEHNLACLQGVVLHALGQVKELAVAQAEQDRHFAQGLKAPHILDGPQQAVKGLASQGIAHHTTLCCHTRCPAPTIFFPDNAPFTCKHNTAV